MRNTNKLFVLAFVCLASLTDNNKHKAPQMPKTPWQVFKEAARDTAISLKETYCFSMSDVQVYDGFMKVFFSESKFKGKAKNNLTNAQGIIQFMPSTIRQLGLPKNVGELSELEQLPHVSKYFRHKMQEQRIKGDKIDSFIDLYMVVFAPAFTTAPDWKTVYRCKSYKDCRKKKKRQCAYHANRGYDTNKDGKILKAEIRDYILKKHYK